MTETQRDDDTSGSGTDSKELFVSESLPARLIKHPTHLSFQKNIRSGFKKILDLVIKNPYKIRTYRAKN